MSSNRNHPRASNSGDQQPQQPIGSEEVPANVASSSRPSAALRPNLPFIRTAQRFNSPFTPREEELQRLLAQERQRSEQRRENYNILKEEHLKLQSEFLKVQAEMKHTLEDTVCFKDIKNNELVEVLSKLEDKTKQVERLEKQLRDNEPDVLRLRMAAELEEPMKRLAKECERLTKERDKAMHETQLARQRLDHAEREHLDSIERIKLSYEAEVNVVKREKEEIRARLVEASQVPDVKRLIELSEENSRLARKLASAQTAIEQAEAQYRTIQSRIEEFVVEQDQKEKLRENEIKQCHDQLQVSRQECKALRSKLELKQSEVDDLTEEISRYKRVEERLRLDAEQIRVRCEQEKEEMRRAVEEERSRGSLESAKLKEQIKKMRLEIESSNEVVQSLHQELGIKNKEMEDKVTLAKKQEVDKALVAEQKRKTLETTLKDTLHEKELLKSEIDKLHRQAETQNGSKLALERELVMLRAKLESQAESMEEFEKIRRQHVALHEELNRLRAENYDLAAANKELTRVNGNTREEFAHTKEMLEKERQNMEEIKLSNDKFLAKLNRRFEEERSELKDKVVSLERENAKLRVTAKSGVEVRQGLNEYNRLRAKQYAKIANRLNVLLEQLKISGEDASAVVGNNGHSQMADRERIALPATSNHSGKSHNYLKRELQAIQQKQAELEACLEGGGSVNSSRRWHVKLED